MLHRFQSRGLGAAAAPQSTAPPRSEFEPIEDRLLFWTIPFDAEVRR